MSGKNNQLKIGALLSYLAIALNIVVGLIYTPWIVEQIGQSQYGLYTLANSLIALFMIDLGLGTATSRYVSKLHADGDEEGVHRFLGAIYKLYLGIDAVIFTALVVFFFLLDKVYVKLTPAELEQFKVVYVIAAGFNVINFPFVTLNGILTAYEKFIPLKLADVIYRVLLVSMTIAALIMGYGLYGLVLVHAVAGLLTTVFKLICIKIQVPVRINFRHTDKSLYKDIFTFSLWATIASLAQRLIFTISPSILGVVSGSAAVAVFGVVVTIEGYTYTITNAINGLFIPKVARLYTEEDASEKISKLLLTVGRFQYALEGLIIVGFAVLGKEFIGLWMGADYLDAYYGLLLVMIPGLFFNALQIAQTAVILKNYMNYNAYITVATGLINVILSFLFSSLWGAIGACVSICIAYLFRAVVFNIFYQKKMKLDMLTFAKKCYVRMSIPMLIAIGLGFVLAPMIPLGGWLGFVVRGVMVTVLYLVLVFAIGLDDRKAVLNKVRSMLHRR